MLFLVERQSGATKLELLNAGILFALGLIMALGNLIIHSRCEAGNYLYLTNHILVLMAAVCTLEIIKRIIITLILEKREKLGGV